MFKKSLLALSLLVGLSSQVQAEMVDFDINIIFDGGLTQSQMDVFTDAERFWESQIVGYAADLAFNVTLDITARGEIIDGVGKILGSAGPTQVFRPFGSSTYYTANGLMRFDTADILALENAGTLSAVINHEIAHVIGFGSLWELNNLYVEGTGEYTGAFALDAYRNEFDSQATFVPVELDGSLGTIDAHWDENWQGPQSDLLTGYLEGQATVSKTSLASFRDLGYVLASDVSMPLYIGLLGFAGLAFSRKKNLA